MFSRILIKLIDESIIPAILLLVTRIVAVVLVAQTQGISYEIGAGGFMFKSTADYVMVNSYSIFYMVIVLTLGLLYILAKSLFFHDSHVAPPIAAKLFSTKLHSLIQNSFKLYTQGSIWLSYCYLLMLIAGFMTLFNFIYPWVFYTSVALCTISTVLLIMDVEEEVKMSRNNSAQRGNL